MKISVNKDLIYGGQTVKKIYLLVLIGALVANQISFGISVPEQQSVSDDSKSKDANTTAYTGKLPGYIQLLNQGIYDCRRQLPVITESAEQTASRTIAGGKLWVAGRQPDFIGEAGGRAGGLMFIKPLDVKSLRPDDSILYAVPGDLNSQDLTTFRVWNDKGIYVVAFASGVLPRDANLPVLTTLIKNSASPGLPVNYNDRQMLCPLDTVLNILNAWTWTGEFASASLRRGKMPVFYQSYGMEGSRQRAEKYADGTFHNGFNIPPIAPGILGKAYVDAIQTSLDNIVARNSNALNCTVAAWCKAKPNLTTAWVIGHMFPEHFQDTRAPQPIQFKTAWHDQKLSVPAESGQFVLYMGYQYAPQLLIDQAAAQGFTLAYISVQPAPAYSAANIIYIDPAWPLADACVNVPGYDIPILPASGVIDAAIYWSLLADYCQSEHKAQNANTNALAK